VQELAVGGEDRDEGFWAAPQTEGALEVERGARENPPLARRERAAIRQRAVQNPDDTGLGVHQDPTTSLDLVWEYISRSIVRVSPSRLDQVSECVITGARE
jgi:hypothetical protein